MTIDYQVLSPECWNRVLRFQLPDSVSDDTILFTVLGHPIDYPVGKYRVWEFLTEFGIVSNQSELFHVQEYNPKTRYYQNSEELNVKIGATITFHQSPSVKDKMSAVVVAVRVNERNTVEKIMECISLASLSFPLVVYLGTAHGARVWHHNLNVRLHRYV